MGGGRWNGGGDVGMGGTLEWVGDVGMGGHLNRDIR